VILRLRNLWRKSTIGRSARVLSRQDQKKIGLVVLLQIALGALDLLGVAAIGVLGALAVNGIESTKPGTRVSGVLNILHLENMAFQQQAAILGGSAAFLLIGRTLVSVFFTRKTLFFLSRRAARISADLVSKLLSQSLVTIQSRTNQQTLYALTEGVSAITLGVVGVFIGVIADSSLLAIMGIGLFLVDPVMALSTLLIFSAIAFLLYKLLNKRARTLGIQNSEMTIRSNEKIVEVLNSYREALVRDRRDFYAREIGRIRLELSNTLAELTFLPNVSKYVVETSVVLGGLLISGIQFLLQDATHAVATLSVFLAAGTRIAPAVLRVQQGTLSIRSNLGTANPTLDLIETLSTARKTNPAGDLVDTEHSGFEPRVSMRDISLQYSEESELALFGVNLEIGKGEIIAFVGPSGAGKTTIVDVLLGVLIPKTGNVFISGVSPSEAVTTWPGAISYVPQDVVIANGTIRENVALGFPNEVATDELVWSALEVAYLDDFVRTLPLGLETQVGERGTKISGGQRQRLGIARAMFTKPTLLVLDEATSALDGETEANITQAIQGLRGSTTVVMIAHRLATVRNADKVVYLSNGHIVYAGTFEEVRAEVEDFERQAKLMGL